MTDIEDKLKQMKSYEESINDFLPSEFEIFKKQFGKDKKWFDLEHNGEYFIIENDLRPIVKFKTKDDYIKFLERMR